MEDMYYSANTVGSKENLASRIGLSDSSMDLEKETAVMTSLEMGVQIGFATYHIAEHCIVEVEKKKLDPKTYLIALVATGDAG